MENIDLLKIPTYTNEDWKKAFIKEVGVESYDAMLFEIDGMKFSPYYSSEDIKEYMGSLPKCYNQIRLGEVFDLRNGKLPLQEILSSLKHGYDAPIFLCDGTLSSDELREIHMDFIQPRFELYEAESEAMINALKEQYENVTWNIVRHYNSSNDSTSSQNFIFEFDTATSILEFLAALKAKLDQISALNPSDVIIRIKLSGQFVEDLVKSRAIKIFWLNYLSARSLEIRSFLCEITWDLTGDYPNETLFHTNNVIVATMAQADHIVLDLKKESENSARILRNSVHIALIESNLGKEQDPVAGSYFIEYVASALAEKAWQGEGK